MNVYTAIASVVMIVIIISVDILFLRRRIWLRLMVNIGIVAVFSILYFAVLRNL
jgi:hypothetical protein